MMSTTAESRKEYFLQKARARKAAQHQLNDSLENNQQLQNLEPSPPPPIESSLTILPTTSALIPIPVIEQKYYSASTSTSTLKSDQSQPCDSIVHSFPHDPRSESEPHLTPLAINTPENESNTHPSNPLQDHSLSSNRPDHIIDDKFLSPHQEQPQHEEVLLFDEQQQSALFLQEQIDQQLEQQCEQHQHQQHEQKQLELPEQSHEEQHEREQQFQEALYFSKLAHPPAPTSAEIFQMYNSLDDPQKNAIQFMNKEYGALEQHFGDDNQHDQDFDTFITQVVPKFYIPTSGGDTNTDKMIQTKHDAFSEYLSSILPSYNILLKKYILPDPKLSPLHPSNLPTPSQFHDQFHIQVLGLLMGEISRQKLLFQQIDQNSQQEQPIIPPSALYTLYHTSYHELFTILQKKIQNQNELNVLLLQLESTLLDDSNNTFIQSVVDNGIDHPQLPNMNSDNSENYFNHLQQLIHYTQYNSTNIINMNHTRYISDMQDFYTTQCIDTNNYYQFIFDLFHDLNLHSDITHVVPSTPSKFVSKSQYLEVFTLFQSLRLSFELQINIIQNDAIQSKNNPKTSFHSHNQNLAHNDSLVNNNEEYQLLNQTNKDIIRQLTRDLDDSHAQIKQRDEEFSNKLSLSNQTLQILTNDLKTERSKNEALMEENAMLKQKLSELMGSAPSSNVLLENNIKMQSDNHVDSIRPSQLQSSTSTLLNNDSSKVIVEPEKPKRSGWSLW